MPDAFRILRRRWRTVGFGRTIEAEHRPLHQTLPKETDSSFEEAAAELRSLTATRQQTPSEILLRESREER